MRAEWAPALHRQRGAGYGRVGSRLPLRRHHVLVTKSTVPIGSGRWLTSIIEDSLPPGVSPDGAFSVVSNPEFLREGSAINDFLFPDRVVIGRDDGPPLDLFAAVYPPTVDQT